MTSDAGRPRARAGLGALVVSLGVLAAACGSPSSAPPPTTVGRAATTVPGTSGASATAPDSTTTAPTTTTTTIPLSTTTTTLPVAVPVGGTRPGGGYGYLGSIRRVPVVAIPDGSLVPPPTAGSAPGPAPGSVLVAFRQFGSGPDLLLVAGEHTTLTSWDPQLLGELAQHYTVTVFDYPGTGFSGPDPAATTVADVADVAAGLSQALGLVSPVVLGWGLGGQVALALAERHPGVASRLVLVDSGPGGLGATRPSAAVSSAMASSMQTDLQIASLMFPPTATASIDGWLARVAKVPRDDLVASAVHDEAVLQASAWADASLEAGLGALAVPVLVVVGSLDEVFPPANDLVLLEDLRDARDLVLPGAGYAAMFQDAPQFVAALETFTG